MNDRNMNIAVIVCFSDLGKNEEKGIRDVISFMEQGNYKPVIKKVVFTTEKITDLGDIDLAVYLGESSRFKTVFEKYISETPVIFVKSTMEYLMDRENPQVPRYRMCMGLDSIVKALAAFAPVTSGMDPRNLDWGEMKPVFESMDSSEKFFVNDSLLSFRKRFESLGGKWVEKVSENEEFVVFLPMHDPVASQLVRYAIKKWPNCTVLAGDGMTETSMDLGSPWPDNVIRMRHWSMDVETPCNELLKKYAGSRYERKYLDFDSCGMLFGTLIAIEQLSGNPDFENIQFDGPLGKSCFLSNGDINPGRMVFLKGNNVEIYS